MSWRGISGTLIICSIRQTWGCLCSVREYGRRLCNQKKEEDVLRGILLIDRGGKMCTGLKMPTDFEEWEQIKRWKHWDKQTLLSILKGNELLDVDWMCHWCLDLVIMYKGLVFFGHLVVNSTYVMLFSHLLTGLYFYINRDKLFWFWIFLLFYMDLVSKFRWIDLCTTLAHICVLMLHM